MTISSRKKDDFEDNYRSKRIKIVKTPKKSPLSSQTDSTDQLDKAVPTTYPFYLDLPVRNLPDNEYSLFKHTDIFNIIPPNELEKLDEQRRPQKTLELIQKAEKKDIVFVGDPGHGKTEIITIKGINDVYNDIEKYILSFVHSRGVGFTQQRKFRKFSRLLAGGKLKYQLYHRDLTSAKKKLIRKKNRSFSMLGITPQTYAGSLAYFLPITVNGNEKTVTKSNDIKWARKLRNPQLIVVDEVDSFPTSTLGLLIPVIRVLKWYNPFTQVILASATLGNPHEMAKRFFGSEREYEVLKGSGRRGKMTLKVEYEEKINKIFDQKFKEIDDHIGKELTKYAIKPSYTPQKLIAFLNHKMTMNQGEASQRFSSHYVVVHGWMSFEEIVDKIDEFHRDLEKIVLVVTSLAQTSFDFTSVNKGMLWGITNQRRDFIQRLSRYNRDPEQEGQVDIVLREYNSFEQRLANPTNREELIEYLTQLKPIPCEVPWFTIESLKFWILFGLVNGFNDVIERIKIDLSPFVDKTFFLSQLQKATRELLLNGHMNYNDDGKLSPTSTTKKWITDKIKVEDNPKYNIVVSKGQNKIILGTIEYSTLLKHCLKGQSLPWQGFNHVIKQINHNKQEVLIERVPRRKYYYTNKIKTKIARSKIQAFHSSLGLALLDLTFSLTLKKPDRRFKKPLIESPPPLTQSQFALFIGDDCPLITDTFQSIDTLVTHLQTTLHIESSELESLKFNDSLLGSGTLVVDKSQLKLAHLMFDFLLYKNKNKTSETMEKDPQSKDNEDKLISLPFSKGMDKLDLFLKKYHSVFGIIADAHIDGTPVTINGQSIEFRQFWRTLLSPLRAAKKSAKKQFWLIFAGDTFDYSHKLDIPAIKTQFYTLLEILEEYELIDNTVFLLGNHDPLAQFFLWQKPLYVRSKLSLEVNPSTNVTFEHGDTRGIEKYCHNGKITEEDIINWRKEQRIKDDDVFIIGHTHIGQCFKKSNTLLVPSLRRYCQSSFNSRLNWLGLFGNGNPFEPESFDIAIDS